jgi:hypothetical protein
MGSFDESDYDIEAGKASTPTPTCQATLSRYTYCNNWRFFIGLMMGIISAALIIVIIVAAYRHQEPVPTQVAGGTIILD